MRIRTEKQRPPSRTDIDRIIKEGANDDDKRNFGYFLRRMRKASFLDSQDQPLQARARPIRQYANDGLVLFLGAGVSKSSGIPNWPELADALLTRSGVAAKDLRTVKKALPSYIAQFELARLLLGSQRRFVEEIHRELYGEMKCGPQLKKIPRRYEKQTEWPGWKDVLKALEENRTLTSVGDLLIVYAGTEPKRNPQIHAVLTSNADCIEELRKLGQDPEFGRRAAQFPS